MKKLIIIDVILNLFKRAHYCSLTAASINTHHSINPVVKLRRFKQLRIACIGFFCFLSFVAHAEVQVQIGPSQVSVDESFQLILTQNNLHDGGIPDLTPLKKDFMIISTERRMNYSIINGQTQSSNEWIITLKAQKEGKLTIPALQVGREHTHPLTINVSKNATPQSTSIDSSQQKDLYLTASVNKKNIYVNQEIIYKVTLYNSKHLLDADYQGPQVENALLIPLGNGKRYQTQKNNVDYLVEEQNYAIFPQKSGPLKIKSPLFSALVYGYNPERIKTQDKTIQLDVQPIPKKFSGTSWLPAKEIKLREHYETSEQTMTQGNTLIRTVTLEGIGVPAQLLPKLTFTEIDGVNVYPEKGKDKNQVIQGELIGNTQIKITYLFNKSGTITIPELKLPWFNTETDQEEIATLPAKTIDVKASAPTPEPTNQPTLTHYQNATQTLPEIKTPNQSNWAWIVAALFAFAWLLTLILWGLQKHHKNIGKGQYKTALNELHNACTQNNPHRTRDALLKWARLHWPETPLLNLTDLTQCTTDAPFKKQVQILSQVLYKNRNSSSPTSRGLSAESMDRPASLHPADKPREVGDERIMLKKHEEVLWRGDELWHSVRNLKNNNPRNKENETALPPMNPA